MKLKQQLGELKAGWTVLGTTFVGLGLSLIPLAQSYSLGVLSGPLENEFGWGRGQIMAATIALFAGAFPASSLVGWIVDRHGVRRVIMGSQIALGGSFVALGLLTKPSFATFIALYFLMGLAGGGTLPVSWMRAIVGWFRHSRGLALGIAQSGTGAAGMLVPLLLAWAVAEHGWRGGYLVLAALPLLIALPLTFFLLKEIPSVAPSQTQPASVERVPSENSLLQAVNSRHFWIIAASFFLAYMVLIGIINNLIPMLMDRGYTMSRAAEMASVMGVSIVVGRLAAAALLDRVWAPLIAFGSLAPTALGVLLLGQPGIETSSAIGAIALIGLAVGAEADVVAYLAARYFGPVRFGRVYGILWVLFSTGAAIGPAMFGAAFDRTGNYDSILTIAALLLAVAAVLLLTLGRYVSSDDASSQQEANSPGRRLLQRTPRVRPE